LDSRLVILYYHILLPHFSISIFLYLILILTSFNTMYRLIDLIYPFSKQRHVAAGTAGASHTVAGARTATVASDSAAVAAAIDRSK
jgi:hypothetical protein